MTTPIYLAFHKPYDVLSQFSNEGNLSQKTLAEFINVPGVYAAGRLDRDSEGLLLLTNDGNLQHRLTDPRFSHPRTYWVQVEGIPSEDSLRQLRSGTRIRDYVTRPAEVRILPGGPGLPARVPPIRVRKSIPDTWIELTLREGRNRQVRHMTAAVGHPTLRLVRSAIGNLKLDNLAPGTWRHLSPDEVRAVYR